MAATNTSSGLVVGQLDRSRVSCSIARLVSSSVARAPPRPFVVAWCCRRRVVSSSLRSVVVVALLLRRRRLLLRRVTSRRVACVVHFTQQILPATHLIANSGDDTACRSIFLMRSRRQNRRLEKTARLIVDTSARRRGCVEMGADGNGDCRQSLVRLFFLSFFAVRVLSFPPE